MVCNEEDCLLYNYYEDTMRHPEIKELFNGILKCKSDLGKINEMFKLSAVTNELKINELKTLCLSCTHFIKTDIKELLTSEKAKSLLTNLKR